MWIRGSFIAEYKRYMSTVKIHLSITNDQTTDKRSCQMLYTPELIKKDSYGLFYK
jgi:hypothetical protein